MNQKKIWYEPHPVSPERKAELRAKGLTIIDAAFRPADHVQEGEKKPSKDAAKAAKASAAMPEGE